MKRSFFAEQHEYKIVDLGNACWVDKQFCKDIQTRQYRSPEVVTESGYCANADIWSLACMLYELLTGDFLFEPKSAPKFSRDEDHLALIQELLGALPSVITQLGRRSSKFFDAEGQLLHISELKFWGLEDILRSRYFLAPAVAEAFADFLLPMLEVNPARRVSALHMLQHTFLDMNFESQALRQHQRMATTEQRAIANLSAHRNDASA